MRMFPPRSMASQKGPAGGRPGGPVGGRWARSWTNTKEKPPGWSRGSAPLGSGALVETPLEPSLDLALDVTQSARPVGVQPYPLGE